MGKFVVIVLDGFGVGAMPDVPQVRPADCGANTCVHIFERTPDLKLPNLASLGLANIVGREFPGLPYSGIFTKDFNRIVNDPQVKIVVEVMGGLHPAYEYVTAAMERGKHVVTANKALVAAYYRELTALAREKGVALRCTAAVGGGIPWLVNLSRVKRLDTVCEVGGIMNGMDATHFAPTGMLTRAQLAQVFFNLYNIGMDQAVHPGEDPEPVPEPTPMALAA